MAQASVPPSNKEKVDSSEQRIQTTTFRYGESDIPLWKAHTTTRLAWDIVNVNRKTIYTAVTMIGLPGWGKTTATQNLVHRIHEIAPYFNVIWHFDFDILKVDKILDKLPKHKPVILVFDDVSWILTDPKLLPSDKKSKLLHKLTRIREVLDPQTKRTQCLLFMDYHYSFAVDKAFRQTPFSIQCSITNEERENYLKTIGHSPTNKKKIYHFTRIIESAYKYDKFRVPAPRGFAEKYFNYTTEAPFRPAMVFNMSQIHLWLQHPVNCQVCAPKPSYDKPDSKLIVELVKAEGIDRVHRDWRIFTALHTGKMSVLNRRDARVMRHILDEHRQFKLPLEEIQNILGEVKMLPDDKQIPELEKRISAIHGRERQKIDDVADSERTKVDKVEVDQDDINLEEVDDKDDDDFDFDHSAAQVAGRFNDDDGDDN